MGLYQFKLPDVGEGTAEAEIVAWHVTVGQSVQEDAPLVDVMTDKATVEMTSPVSGRVVEIIGAPGDMAPVGSIIVSLEIEGTGAGAPTPPSPPPPLRTDEALAVSKSADPSPPPSAAFGDTDAPPADAPRPPPRRLPGARPLASPAVRRRAEDLGVKLAFVPGSGPAGRISQGDLEAYLAQEETVARDQPEPRGVPPLLQRTAVETVKVIGLRRKIAEKMAEAKRRIPHFAYVEEVDMTELEALRTHLNQVHADRAKLTALPFFIRALVKILPEFPQINARYDDEAGVVRRYAAVHVGVAVQTPNGLVVPVVRHAEALDLWATATEVARLASAARSGKAKADELTGSTITLTSLGPLGGVATTPVINHPEVAIIGPNKIIERPAVHLGQVTVRKMMNLSSSFDHRVVDGYDAAAFIQRVKVSLEHPATLFMD
jgi:2-oxoisovalerate dehydrogenase E2 component (dihydrolipoyl transacylase)